MSTSPSPLLPSNSNPPPPPPPPNHPPPRSSRLTTEHEYNQLLTHHHSTVLAFQETAAEDKNLITYLREKNSDLTQRLEVAEAHIEDAYAAIAEGEEELRRERERAGRAGADLEDLRGKVAKAEWEGRMLERVKAELIVVRAERERGNRDLRKVVAGIVRERLRVLEEEQEEEEEEEEEDKARRREGVKS